ncbi:FAD-binding protein [Rhodococcus globerulus]|uniref:FAD-binding protein n=1 Tax=Rhodococcus globerulus TaxID=33008 RepID=UPI001FB0408F|nr:FAD-binding protein [Rhodococcus globerulus]
MILVEATDKFGGTTAYSGGGGVWFPCNPVLQRAGTDDTIEDALEYYHAVVGDRTRANCRTVRPGWSTADRIPRTG